MPTTIVRTVILYLFIVAAMKIMGKRQIGQLQISELVTVTILSELASYSILDADIPLVYSIVPVFVLIALEVAISYFSVKSRFISKLFDGKPSFIIYKGEINRRELVSSRLTLTEVISEIRAAGIKSVNDVYYMILEPGGKISVIPKVSKRPPDASELGVFPPEDGIDHAIVIDGKSVPNALSAVGQNQKWLDSILRSNKIGDISEIFYLAVNDCGDVTLIKKREKGE